MIYEIPSGDHAGTLVNLNYCMVVEARYDRNYVELIFPGNDNRYQIPFDIAEERVDIVKEIKDLMSWYIDRGVGLDV